MVRFINEIILKYLLGISKCTKLPGKKRKQNDISETSTSLHIGHIYILEIILATFFSKIFFSFFFFFLFNYHCYFFLEKKKVSPRLY